MIVSDSHKFIFFHVPKSAGTSIACKLAPYSNNRKQLFPYYELYLNEISLNTDNQYEDQSVKKMFDLVPEEDMSWYYLRRPEEFSWLNLPHYIYTPHPRLSSVVGDNHRCMEYLDQNKQKHQEYCKFCIVRNSWDYAFSIFKNKVVVDGVAKEYIESDPYHDWDDMIISRTTKESFCNFIRNLEEDYTQIYIDFFFDITREENLLQQHFFCDPNLENLADFVLRFDNLHIPIEKIDTLVKPLKIPVDGRDLLV